MPFGGRLDANNRWVKLATLVPWERVHVLYDEGLSRFEGAPSLSARIAFGALFIKDYLGVTDRELVVQVQENPYLQYFLGLDCFK